MTTSAKPEATEIWLQYLLHEDEAEETGVSFKIEGARATIQWTYNFPEYEPSPKSMTRTEARELYRQLWVTNQYRAYQIRDGKAKLIGKPESR